MRAAFSAQDNATLFCKPPGPSAPPAVVAELWMNATGGVKPYTYVWSFGDGTSTASSRPGMVQVYQQFGEFKVLGVVYDPRTTLRLPTPYISTRVGHMVNHRPGGL